MSFRTTCPSSCSSFPFHTAFSCLEFYCWLWLCLIENTYIETRNKRVKEVVLCLGIQKDHCCEHTFKLHGFYFLNFFYLTCSANWSCSKKQYKNKDLYSKKCWQSELLWQTRSSFLVKEGITYKIVLTVSVGFHTMEVGIVSQNCCLFFFRS